jgi:hypothetical protein
MRNNGESEAKKLEAKKLEAKKLEAKKLEAKKLEAVKRKLENKRKKCRATTLRLFEDNGPAVYFIHHATNGARTDQGQANG